MCNTDSFPISSPALPAGQHCPHNSGGNVTKCNQCNDARPDVKTHRHHSVSRISEKIYGNLRKRRDDRRCRESVQKRKVILEGDCHDRGHPHVQPMLHVSAALAGVNPAVPSVSSVVTSTSIPRFSVAHWMVATSRYRHRGTSMLRAADRSRE